MTGKVYDKTRLKLHLCSTGVYVDHGQGADPLDDPLLVTLVIIIFFPDLMLWLPKKRYRYEPEARPPKQEARKPSVSR
jgi:hypothetical protein